VRDDKKGARYAVSTNIGFDNHRRGRNLLLGHRQVRHGPPPSESTQVARRAHWLGRYITANSANDWDLLNKPAGRSRRKEKGVHD
jgi:hypothetical protein